MPNTKKSALKILIVEDHPLTARGLRALIEAETDLVVCAESSTCGQALDQAIKTKPDLVIADISLPGRSGFELIQDLHSRCPGLPTLIFSVHLENTYARRALEIGAKGYVMKSDSSETLLEAIRIVLNGGIFLSPLMSNMLLASISTHSKQARTGVEALSPKEFEVFRLFGEGLSTVDISKRLNMSPKTVDSHREHIKVKLQIHTISELIAFASRWCTNQCSSHT